MFKVDLTKYSIKYQLLTSFSAISLLSSIATLVICYALLSHLGDNAYQSVKETLNKQEIASAITISNEISYALNKQLLIIGQTNSMEGALYSSLLLQNTIDTTLENANNTSIFLHQDYFKEYNFKEGCEYPTCPKDTTLLGDSSRYPYFLQNLYGSLNHSSVYLYSDKLKSSVRDDRTWSRFYNQSSALRRVINGLSYKDDDFYTLYKYSNNREVIFYVTVRIDEAFQDYLTVHRTYPGIQISSEIYDPSNENWFQSAPIDSFNLVGPYEQSFVNKSVYFLSSKQFTEYSDFNVTIVSSTILLESAFVNLIGGITFPKDGFGVLLKYETLEVIVWGQNNSMIKNNPISSLSSIYDYEPNIGNNELLRSSGYFYFTDKEKVDWLVVSNPFLQLLQNNTSNEYTLILLVFLKVSTIRKPLSILHNDIKYTTGTTVLEIIIISIGVLLFNLCLIFLFIRNFVKPLEVIRHKSKEIVQMSLNDDDNIKDYATVVNDVKNDMTRRDEVGLLALDYVDMVRSLNDKHLQQNKRSKYETNPFHQAYTTVTKETLLSSISSSLDEKDTSTTTWDNLCNYILLTYSKDKSNQMKKQDSVFSREDNVYIGEDILMKNIDLIFSSYASLNCKIDLISSTKTKLSIFSSIILAGLIAIMILTFLRLYFEGGHWISSTKSSMVTSYESILFSLADSKAIFAQAFFNQLGIECLVNAAFLKSIMTHKFTNIDLINQGRYLPSYSIDPYNPYVSPTKYSKDYSMYFAPYDQYCDLNNCTKTHNSTDVKLTSLWDIKTRSLLYPGSTIIFSTLGTHNGLLRDLPINVSSKYSHPTTCFVYKPYDEICANDYYSSSCSSHYSGPKHYPPYDPRCRNWYYLGTNHKLNLPYYLPPTITVQGNYDIYVIANVRNETDLLAVYLANVNFQQVTDAVNQLKILDRGYCYIISQSSPWTIISHPYAGPSCDLVECAESALTKEEYYEFNKTVLTHIRLADYAAIPSNYLKKGELWEISIRQIEVQTFPMILVVTVPRSDITEPSNNMSKDINHTLVAMIIAFVLAIATILLTFFILVSLLIKNIIIPINQLRLICLQVINDDPINFAEVRAYSRDMVILLNAFSNLLDTFRNGYELFINGDYYNAKELFFNTLILFKSIQKITSVAVCENNLGCVEFVLGNYQVSEFQFKESIRYNNIVIQKLLLQIDKEIIEELDNERISSTRNDRSKSILSARITRANSSVAASSNQISGRVSRTNSSAALGSNQISRHSSSCIDMIEISKNIKIEKDKEKLFKLEYNLTETICNLCLLYLKINKLKECYNLLNDRIEYDKKRKNYIGLVKLLGIKGFYYTKLHKYNEAKEIFDLSLIYIENYEKNYDIEQNYNITYEYVILTKQMVLYNIANFYDEIIHLTNIFSYEDIEKRFLDVLIIPLYMDKQIILKVFYKLKVLYKTKKRENDLILLDLILNKLFFESNNLDSLNFMFSYNDYDNINIIPKNILFLMDNSKQMIDKNMLISLSKINEILYNNINFYDFIRFATFNNEFHYDNNINSKKDFIPYIKHKFDNFPEPKGQSHFYDAIISSINLLGDSIENNNWIIAIIGGGDNGSDITNESLCEILEKSKINLIVISVTHLKKSVIHDIYALTHSSNSGMFIHSMSDLKRINPLFGTMITNGIGVLSFQYC